MNKRIRPPSSDSFIRCDSLARLLIRPNPHIMQFVLTEQCITSAPSGAEVFIRRTNNNEFVK
ncbi:MAG: hypothetical protein HZB51_03555 [Chloroflexi bacterium]|nr:hypothetical protein [Chloroflexota bacterium]